jgi:glycerol-3-phosphate dehydrogenase subunit B
MTAQRRLVVVGGGAAGTAAAFAASRHGADVTVVPGKGGATSLSSGALDGAVDRSAETTEFLRALGIWEIGAEACRVPTMSGSVRAAAGRDVAVLDLERVRGDIAVARVARRGWDADGLARAWNVEPWSRERGARFVPVDVTWLRTTDEHHIPDVDLAMRCDDADRIGWLAERLRGSSVLQDKAAVLIGPWLGLAEGTPRALSEAVGKPIGETLSQPGGVAGARFDRARDRLFATLGVHTAEPDALVTALSRGSVELATGSTLQADAVVLATGGLLGGGLAWRGDGVPPGAAEPLARTGFAVTVRAPGRIGHRGQPLDARSSRFGAAFEPFAWSGGNAPAGFERVGVLSSSTGAVLDDDRAPLPWLYVAGDLAADRPRTLLEAIRSGLAAGREAARGAA